MILVTTCVSGLLMASVLAEPALATGTPTDRVPAACAVLLAPTWVLEAQITAVDGPYADFGTADDCSGRMELAVEGRVRVGDMVRIYGYTAEDEVVITRVERRLVLKECKEGIPC